MCVSLNWKCQQQQTYIFFFFIHIQNFQNINLLDQLLTGLFEDMDMKEHSGHWNCRTSTEQILACWFA